ncbi:adhesion G-protein coupled receptor G6-like isoform X6 [Polyodon spathula]|uniref:adhesion G-protein coupled receptor G6-like isoform X6 n=1 Tax=Polyodon spathula TaxID=7913 RepID=UPI001B7EC5DB|nr:adhesion G-protein coupled receptor G6-like isoform X6 [Polyodon spathula]
MMSNTSGLWCSHLRWTFQNVLYPLALLLCVQHTAVLGCRVDCRKVLTSSNGVFTSPCYPSEYPNSQACKWTLQAPTGYIIQITFLDFEIEEAPQCIYDNVIVSNGKDDVKFCGITANGLTLNSTGNVMNVSFATDFSVQKKGFKISYKQVAVSLRNQKLTLNLKESVSTATSVTIPNLQHFTVCFEASESVNNNKDWIFFSYKDSSSTEVLTFGKSKSVVTLSVVGADCDLSDAVSNIELFSVDMQLFCLTWDGTTGYIAISTVNTYKNIDCPASKYKVIPRNGVFSLGPSSKKQDSFTGGIYNFRLWNSAMSTDVLSALSCADKGDVIDWENEFWNIAASYLTTDQNLSCVCSPNCKLTTIPSSGTSSSATVPKTSCSSSQLGCPAIVTATNMIATNPANNVIVATSGPDIAINMPTTTRSTINSFVPTPPVTSNMPTMTSSTTDVIVTSVAMPLVTSDVTMTTSTITDATLIPSTTAADTTNTIGTNSIPHEGVFYRISFVLYENENHTTALGVEQFVYTWLNQTFQNWTYPVYVANVSVQMSNSVSTRLVRSVTERYICQALLVYKFVNDILLLEETIHSRLVYNNRSIGGGLLLDTVAVHPVENCVTEENPFYYKWPESRPTVTQYLPCFPNKALNASRTCMLNLQNYTSYWGSADLNNCTGDIDSIAVSAENAADVATQLVDITNHELTTEEVTKIVTKLNQIISVATINVSLASTVVSVFSKVLTNSDTALAASSPLALKTVDDLALKILFTGPSLSITSKNLALGIAVVNSSTFNGTSFSAARPTNTSDLQVSFESDQGDPLATLVLPATLLNNLSEAEIDSVSRIQFTFFSKTGLFQDQIKNGLYLSSYVVASSVGNASISNLQDPVKIQIQHTHYQTKPNPVCVFWDFTLQNDSGGWNADGCTVSSESTRNTTVCLCNHLTHFGVLMDISGTATQIDAKNTKILTIITYIGCGVSAIFSAATLLTYIAFEKLRRDYPSKILMNLSTALLFLNMVFLLDGWLATFEIDGLCIAVAVFLHFFLLTSFTWMGLEAVHMYIALVKVFNTYIRKYILKFCIVGWGLPAVTVAIVVAIDRKFYGKQYYGKGENGEGSSEFCWVKNQVVFYITCAGYFGIVFLLNVAMFIVVMVQICGRNGKRSNRTLREEILRNLRSVISLTFLLGMTWGFAFFAWGPVNLTFMYLFAIFNSLQGLFIFIFHCALKENVQKQWRRYLCFGRFRLADNSDWSKTATNNTKKASSDNLGKSLSSSSTGSSSTNWKSKSKTILNPFAKRNSNTGNIYGDQTSMKSGQSEGDQTSIIPVHQVIDKVKGYCSVRSDNFYKNIIMSDSFSHSTKF